MPPKSNRKDDLEEILVYIEECLEACKRGLYEHPWNFKKALSEANEASNFAMAYGMKDIERSIRYYQAECCRKLKWWEEAYELYERCTVVTEEDKQWVREMQLHCRAEAERLRGDDTEGLSRDNAGTSKPRKRLRPSHQEGRGNVKEHRGAEIEIVVTF
ncbi:hypothetical protein TRIATDRAFT_318857 [Trichoderma atroviride IMI 206040]|uniref:Uncharacterized protein n=1 Tax=Hypocrea atroviridis (strain ATCC 20476 / IMI 206040) TaxID=452589 RepID=G9NWJ5_HYPAI|nr:uncharacterized protein TRIATDRAFT_318857 [Trichoderma atroviride IMI 206040]EHK45350.1 hypothetical protein TRIATDRAFT_318857 [Trichoderma atroviride IMI 206040]